MARYALVACDVTRREFEAAAAASPNRIECDFLPQGLHERAAGARDEIQSHVDLASRPGVDAILVGYGLCGRATAGIAARGVPLVVPRIHDCIALLLGSRARYEEEFRRAPGTYYLSSGWIERATKPMDSWPAPAGMGEAFGSPEEARRAYTERFGEEAADALVEEFRGWAQNYRRLAWIRNGQGDEEALSAEVRRRAAARGLAFEEIRTDLRYFEALVNGPPWDPADFLIVPPGRTLRPSAGPDVFFAATPA